MLTPGPVMVGGSRLTDEAIPSSLSFKYRLSLTFVRFLLVHRRADSMMCGFAVWWGALTLAFPDFWGAWQPTMTLAAKTGNHPGALSGVLLVTGLMGYAASKLNWHWLRVSASMARFLCWSLMVVVFLSITPIATPGVACYSAFAMAELMAYVNNVIKIESLPLITERQAGRA